MGILHIEDWVSLLCSTARSKSKSRWLSRLRIKKKKRRIATDFIYQFAHGNKLACAF